MKLGAIPDLPGSLLRFIAAAIPTYLSAEVLLFLAARPERSYKPEEIVVEMRPVVITLPDLKEYLDLFRLLNIVEKSDGYFRYKPSSPQLETEIEALAQAYNERPVTLIYAIHQIAESRV